jgi:hypothetical protein
MNAFGPTAQNTPAENRMIRRKRPKSIENAGHAFGMSIAHGFTAVLN